MRKFYTHLFFLILLLLPHLSFAALSYNSTIINDQEIEIKLHVNVGPEDFLYKDYLTFSVDHPDITLSPWKSSIEPVNHYDVTFKDTKKIFNQSLNFVFTAHHTNQQPISDAYLHVSYYLYSNHHIDEKIFPLSFEQPAQTVSGYSINSQIPSSLENSTEHSRQAPTPVRPAKPAVARKSEGWEIIEGSSPNTTFHASPKTCPPASPFSKQFDGWSTYITSLIESANSLTVRLILVLLLGILLSLTPCVYPMIPITIGVLQSGTTQANSMGRNFLLSVSYVAGIATTFAIFGLLAAFTGHIFGSLSQSPLVILLIIAMLIYLGLSLLGFYNMYVPKTLSSLSSPNNNIKTRSLLSTFFFGAATGTIASPCISPGLVLLLSIVTTMDNAFYGFILLFFFGVGLGLPLIIVGTFAGSINLLPASGVWMLEIKKLFGFMLLGICFYFARPLIAYHLLLYAIALFACTVGIYYIYDSNKTASRAWRIIKTILGIVLFASSFIIAFYGYKAMSIPRSSTFTLPFQ